MVLFLIATIAIGQNRIEKEIQGIITVESSPVEGVNILNSTNQKTTVSDKNGLFSLQVSDGDILVFSAVNLVALRKKVTKFDLKSNKLSINMTSESISLKEVIIPDNSNITAENFRIIPYGQKKYSPAERRLQTAGDFKPIMLLNILGGSMPLDPLINKINGRTKYLKKLVALEKKEECVKLIADLYNQEYFTVTLGIPADSVNGFKYFAVENEKFTSVLKSKNNTMITFLIGELAVKYNEILSSENK